jgi:hypothetical protein
MTPTQSQFPFVAPSPKNRFLLSLTIVTGLMLLAPGSVQASTIFNYTGSRLSDGGVIRASVTLPCQNCPPGKYDASSMLGISVSYGSVTLSWQGNSSVTDPWITLNSNGDVVDWHLLIQSGFPPYVNFIVQTINTTDPRYRHLSTADGAITGGIYDAVLFRQTPALEILEFNKASPGTWVATPVSEPVCMAQLRANECGITFTNGNKTFAIAVDRDYVCLTLDGAGSVDPDGDPLQIDWLIDDTNIVAGTVVTNCLNLGCHTIRMMASDGQARCQQSLEVCVITPEEAVQQCIDLVEQAQLARKNKRPLIATLKAARAAFDRGGRNVGAHLLKIFQHKVRTQVARNNSTEAAMFIACAENVLEAVECVGRRERDRFLRLNIGHFPNRSMSGAQLNLRPRAPLGRSR